MTAGDPLLETGAAADEPLEELRTLVEDVLDDLRQKIDDLPERICEIAVLIEDTDVYEAMMNELDQVEDIIASAFARAAERLDL